MLLPFVKKVISCVFIFTHSKAEGSQHICVCHGQQRHVVEPSIAQNYSDFMRRPDTSGVVLYSRFDRRRDYITVGCSGICFSIFQNGSEYEASLTA